MGFFKPADTRIYLSNKYIISRASPKYNKSLSYICFWKARWNSTAGQALACQSQQPHSYPNQHTEEVLKLIRDMRRRNPRLGMVELRPAPESLHVLPGKPVPGNEETGPVSIEREETSLQAKAL